VITVYVAGLFQGLALVAFPAASSQLTGPSDYDLSNSQYGLIFVPQVIMAITGSLLLPELSRRFGLKRLLLAGIAADVASMTILVAGVAAEGRGPRTRCCWSARGFLG